MTDERDDLVVLVDENGEEVTFEHLDSFELNGQDYVVLIPMDDEEAYEEEEEAEVVIMKLQKDENDEDTLMLVEDEAELDAAFEEFQSRMDQYEEEDEEEE